MAATFALACHFHASARTERPPISFPSQKLTRLASSISSFAQPALQELLQAPVTGADVIGLVKKASAQLLDAAVDFTFRFSDQPWTPSQSNFVPVDEIGEAVVVKDIEGVIPADLPEGIYIRNGSNPMFGSLQSASSPFGFCSESWVEGEGMLHAVSFSRAAAATDSTVGVSGVGDGWTVSYKNRFVESDTFRLERRRNRPCFLPAIMGDALSVAAASLLNQLRFGKFSKDLCNTNVFEHSGRVFAIAENHMPQEIELLNLGTIGKWDLNRAWNRPFIAHPKKAPGSGELVFVGANVNRPYLVLGIVSADGKELKHKADLKLERSIICHDIGVTKRYNIILDMPLTFDKNRLMKGGPLIKFEKESYARIGVMPRYGDANSIKWFQVEPYCTFHIVNCYENDDEVIVMGCRSYGSIIPGPDLGSNKHQWFSSGFEQKLTDEDCDDDSNKGLFFSRLHEWRLNMKSGGVTERYLTGKGFSSEFPMINDFFGGLYNQYAYTQVVDSEASSICGLPKYGSLAKFYLDEKNTNLKLHNNKGGEYIKVEKHQLGANEFCSGAAFIPKQGSVEEDDGWIISFVHNEHTNKSQVHIIDAKNFECDPVAKITLPSRVPYGFHGAFIPRLNLL